MQSWIAVMLISWTFGTRTSLFTENPLSTLECLRMGQCKKKLHFAPKIFIFLLHIWLLTKERIQPVFSKLEWDKCVIVKLLIQTFCTVLILFLPVHVYFISFLSALEAPVETSWQHYLVQLTWFLDTNLPTSCKFVFTWGPFLYFVHNSC